MTTEPNDQGDQQAPPPPDQTAGEDAPDEKPGAEAAKYRRRLRDTERERDTLSARVEAMQKREVERLVATDLATPGDLWLTDASLPEMLDESGDIDPAKVTQAVAGILESRPGWRRTTPSSFDGGARTSASTGVTFQQVLQGGRRR